MVLMRWRQGFSTFCIRLLIYPVSARSFPQVSAYDESFYIHCADYVLQVFKKEQDF